VVRFTRAAIVTSNEMHVMMLFLRYLPALRPPYANISLEHEPLAGIEISTNTSISIAFGPKPIAIYLRVNGCVLLLTPVSGTNNIRGGACAILKIF
jgi:hypothetical protein